MNMWFRGEYEVPILTGRKRSTVRRASTRLPRVGQEIGLSRGARPAFARAVVTHVASLSEMSPQKAAELRACYGEDIDLAELRVIRFRLVSAA